MTKLTPEETAAKHSKRLKAAIPDIRKGVEAVTEAPGKKAAAQADKMLAGITKSVQSGKWAKNTAAVSLEEWKEKTLTKGVNNIGVGIDASIAKTTEFYRKLQAHQKSIDTELANMANLTLEDGIARATHQMRRMNEFKN